MKKHKALTLLMAIMLLLPAIFGVSKVFAAIASFTIGDVAVDESVTILIKDAPKNRDFVVRMGEYNTKAIDGIESGQFNTGDGGNLQATIQIPEALKGRAQIAIRMDSTTGGWYYYNWFWNKKDGGSWPTQTTPPSTEPPADTTTPTKPPANTVPTITIKSVEAGTSVTITGTNFPKNVDVTAYMGKMFSRGINGTAVGEFNTGDADSFEVTLNIPEAFEDYTRIAVRLETVKGGWYSYNWFWNN